MELDLPDVATRRTLRKHWDAYTAQLQSSAEQADLGPAGDRVQHHLRGLALSTTNSDVHAATDAQLGACKKSSLNCTNFLLSCYSGDSLSTAPDLVQCLA